MSLQVKLYPSTIHDIVSMLGHIEVDEETMVYIINKLNIDKEKLVEILKEGLAS